MPQDNNNLSAVKDDSVIRQRIAEQVDDSANAFDEQVDGDEFYKDAKKNLSVINKKLNEYEDISNNTQDISNTVLKEKFSSMYLMLKNLYSINVNMNNWLQELSKQNKELIKDKRDNDFEDSTVNESDSSVDPTTRIAKLENRVAGFEQFFENAKPETLARLISQLESFQNDKDIKSMTAIKSVFGNKSPEEVLYLLQKLPDNNTSIRFAKENGVGAYKDDNKNDEDSGKQQEDNNDNPKDSKDEQNNNQQENNDKSNDEQQEDNNASNDSNNDTSSDSEDDDFFSTEDDDSNSLNNIDELTAKGTEEPIDTDYPFE